MPIPPPIFLTDGLSLSQFATLADIHVRFYNKRLRSGAFVIDTEHQKYRTIWSVILSKVHRAKDVGEFRASLLNIEMREIQKALDSGDYDAILILNQSSDEVITKPFDNQTIQSKTTWTDEELSKEIRLINDAIEAIEKLGDRYNLVLGDLALLRQSRVSMQDGRRKG